MCDGREALADRCRAVRLPVWPIGPDGVLDAAPSGWGAADAWLGAPALRRWAQEAAEATPSDERRAVVEPFPGCRLLRLGTEAPGGSTAGLIALAPGPEIFDTEEFRSICRESALDAGRVRAALEDLVRAGGRDLEDLARALAWVGEHCRRERDLDQAVNEFSQQLLTTYEQISVLYRLGRSMNCLDEPMEFVEITCNLLLGVLDFTWVAVVLDRHAPVGDSAPRMVVAGDLPCPGSRFEQSARALLDGQTGDSWTVLLEPETSDLGRLVSAQVLADPVVLEGRPVGMILAGSKHGADADVTSFEIQLVDAAADYIGAFLQNVEMYDEQRSMFMGTMHALTAAIDAKDRYTRGHSERVAFLAARLAEAMGQEPGQVERVHIAGLVHDVGKIGVPEAVLQKAGRLTDEEFEQIKRHPVIGHRIVRDIPPLADVLPGVLYHHERVDGRGYPEGLAGDGIPLLGRIIAVADAFDAMSSDRSYRPAMSRPKVLEEIARCAGTQFDAELARLFLTLDLAGYDEMVRRHMQQDRRAA